MAYDKPVMKSKVYSAPKVLSTADRENLQKNSSNTIKIAQEERQEAIDRYNTSCTERDAFFDDYQLAGKHIIVKLFKENFIKAIESIQDNIFYDSWISKVDGRERQTSPENWVENPLPYIFSGVIVAISPLAQAEIEKEYKECAQSGIIYNKLKVGSIVDLQHFMFPDYRFYKNKQERDMIRNPKEYRIEYWEGLVRIHPSIVEGIIPALELSPYQQYKNSIK